MKTKQMKAEDSATEGLSDQARQALGEAFGKIEEVQRSLAPTDTPLVKYLLDMAKLEIARKGTGLPFGSLGENEPTDAWIKALRSEEGEEPAGRRRPN